MLELCPRVQRPLFGVHVLHHGTTRTVAVQGEFDLAGSRDFEAAVTRALRHRPETLVIDLTEVEFIDVTGIGCLLRADRQAEAHELRLVICPGPGPVHAVLALCGLEGTLPFVTQAPS